MRQTASLFSCMHDKLLIKHFFMTTITVRFCLSQLVIHWWVHIAGVCCRTELHRSSEKADIPTSERQRGHGNGGRYGTEVVEQRSSLHDHHQQSRHIQVQTVLTVSLSDAICQWFLCISLLKIKSYKTLFFFREGVIGSSSHVDSKVIFSHFGLIFVTRSQRFIFSARSIGHVMK